MIWDLNIRIFHVLLIILTILTIASIKLNIFFLHQYFGVTFIGLIVFRIYWGFYGSFYSRFKNFYYSPGEIILFIKGYKIYKVGHNPLGSLSIFSFYFYLV